MGNYGHSMLYCNFAFRDNYTIFTSNFSISSSVTLYNFFSYFWRISMRIFTISGMLPLFSNSSCLALFS